MRGSKKHNPISRKEYHSILRLIFGRLLRKLKSLCEIKSNPKIHPTPNTYIFYHETPETMSDKHNRACILPTVKRSVKYDLILTGFMASYLALLPPVSPEIRN